MDTSVKFRKIQTWLNTNQSTTIKKLSNHIQLVAPFPPQKSPRLECHCRNVTIHFYFKSLDCTPKKKIVLYYSSHPIQPCLFAHLLVLPCKIHSTAQSRFTCESAALYLRQMYSVVTAHCFRSVKKSIT